MSVLLDFAPDGRDLVRDVFFETGFCRGETLRAARWMDFNEWHSVEVYRPHCELGWVEFKDDPAVRIHHGSSPEVITAYADPTRDTLFFLDAHYQADLPGEIDLLYGECPVLHEVAAIAALPWKNRPVVVVDDAHHLDRPWDDRLIRLFRIEQWPTVAEVADLLPGYDAVRKGHVLYFIPPEVFPRRSARA